MISVILALVLSPLLLGFINQTKAFFAGRVGVPFTQLYFDLFKLFKKDFVYSKTTTWVFRVGPIINISAALIILLFLPLSVISFKGDIILVMYLLGLMRFFTIVAALDTGSAFEGMGASREVLFSTFVEPAFLLGIGALAIYSKSLSFYEVYQGR